MRAKLIPSLLFLMAFFSFGCNRQVSVEELVVSGVESPEILLNGTWKFSMEPPDSFWENSVDFQNWPDIQVPGECQMQGFAIRHNTPYVYKKKFVVPEDYDGKHIQLNFYGVYSYAKIWLNGNYVRDHYGGFTKWNCDISDYAQAGEEAILTVEFVDRTDDISYGSGYAKHQIGGILRDVELVALPKQHFTKLYFETDLDEDYQDGALNIFYELSQNSPTRIKIELLNAENQLIEAAEQEVTQPTGKLIIPVENPQKWDAEHPYLYTVATTLLENGKESIKQAEKIGFREVEVRGNKLLVNGQPVKLRGANRHDIHPLLGRMTTPEYDKRDVLLAKEANMNFIRTSHYPPSETFLDYCDQYGIYVEDETAVCFVGSHRTEAYRETGATQSDPDYTHWYLSQLEEMVQHHRNHPSVIIWSIGNENVFGSNFVKSFEWVKENDPTRPVIYSYPGQVPDSLKIYEIISMHYPSWQGNLTQYGISVEGFESEKMPMLFDEWAHVACYNNFELKTDPNVRNFWGQSLDSMWTYTFEADGALGGAIWCMLDETFMLPRDLEGFNQWWGILDPNVIPSTYTGPCVGYGEWGIVDTWRRKKPEFWNTKKAYSPSKIYQKRLESFQQGEALEIPVHNRFDHTNFSELKITWKYKNNSGEVKNMNLGPHEKGKLIIPANEWEAGETLNLCFFQNDTFLVDEYQLPLGEKKINLPRLEKGEWNSEETSTRIVLSKPGFKMEINKTTGLIENVTRNDEILLKSGPHINLQLPGERVQYSTIQMDDYAQNWECTGFEYEINDGVVAVDAEGRYDSIAARFHIRADAHGTLHVDYQMDELPAGMLIEEAGIKFITGDAFQTLSWESEGYFTHYPEHHLGSLKGEADLNEKPPMNYRENPEHPWSMDSKGFYYFGLDKTLPYTNIVRSLKENVRTYGLKTGGEALVKVLSSGSQACRFDRLQGENTLIINDHWDYTSLLWGNYMKQIPLPEKLSGEVVMKVK